VTRRAKGLGYEEVRARRRAAGGGGVPVLGPGSYWFQPGGVAHGDECVADSCLMQIVWSGPRDGRLADSAAETTARPESVRAPSPP
jgi:hypothetical protein